MALIKDDCITAGISLAMELGGCCQVLEIGIWSHCIGRREFQRIVTCKSSPTPHYLSGVRTHDARLTCTTCCRREKKVSRSRHTTSQTCFQLWVSRFSPCRPKCIASLIRCHPNAALVKTHSSMGGSLDFASHRTIALAVTYKISGPASVA